METAVAGAFRWMEENPTAEREDFVEKLAEVEAVCNPIVSAAYQRGEESIEEEDEDTHDEL